MTIKQLLRQEQLHEFMEASEEYFPTIKQLSASDPVPGVFDKFALMPEYIKARAWIQAAVKESEKERVANSYST